MTRELLELTDITAKRLLKKMVEDGILVAIGEKKSRKYVLSK
jgi:Fic family protein